MADVNKVMIMIGDLQKNITAMELFAREGDSDSLGEAKNLIKETQKSLNGLKQELQATTPLGMSAGDIKHDLDYYSDAAMVEVCVPTEDGVGAFYLVKGISDLAGTSPTIPVIDLGECISC